MMDHTLGRPQHRGDELQAPWEVHLFIAGMTPSSRIAINNLNHLKAEYFPPGSRVEIIDLLEDPERGRHDHVLATPTLIRVKPAPVRRIIGNLSDRSRTLDALGLGNNRP